jgi:hypothetical protein
MGLSSRHFTGIRGDYQSGIELPHSKGSADLFTGFSYVAGTSSAR